MWLHQYGKGPEVLISPYIPFPLFDLTPAFVLYCVVLFSRSQNKDVSPRKVLPYICMAPSPDTSCSFSQCVNANSAWLLPPTILVWLHNYPSSCSVCDMNISHLAFQASTETDAAGASTGVEIQDILSQWISFTKLRKRSNIDTTSMPSAGWHHLSEMTTKGSGVGSRNKFL